MLRTARAVRRNKPRVAKVSAYAVSVESERQIAKSEWQIFIRVSLLELLFLVAS